ncbi:hypothetical protein [Salibacterium halotolerans]|uniref:Uncharacterized protein n=1 Tax=Salibacterium halotolerans TaxID=1884432 RepID=A0A1I5SC29_9BACI|nr:hypothetical protein [Salibacterium halotolerans]SFP67876.1 hypothetical protein SAMN05518683_108117 [Salibacterium halotolerans]
MSKSFEERMKELEDGYRNMPDSKGPDEIIQGVEKRSKKRTSRRRMYTFGGTLAAAGIAAMLVMSQQGTAPGPGHTGTAPGDEEQESPDAGMQEAPAEPEDETPPALTEERAVEVMTSYRESFETLVNDTDSQRVASYESLDGVRQHFEKVMSEELAQSMTDSYFRMQNGSVYVVAMDAPTWLQEDQSFTLEQEAEDHVRIVQERSNEMLGHVEMVYHAVYNGDRWILDDIVSTQLDEGNTAGENAGSGEEAAASAAQSVVDYLISQDWTRLSELVHPQEGVLFSPYVYVREDEAQVFQAEEIESFFQNEQQHVWGTQDGSGRPIEMTPSAYYEEYIYDPGLSDPDEMNVGEIAQRGSMQNNIQDVFPDATVVEFYVEGSGESAQMNWSALNVVMKQDESGAWKVVALVNDEWTI